MKKYISFILVGLFFSSHLFADVSIKEIHFIEATISYEEGEEFCNAFGVEKRLSDKKSFRGANIDIFTSVRGSSSARGYAKYDFNGKIRIFSPEINDDDVAVLNLSGPEARKLYDALTGIDEEEVDPTEGGQYMFQKEFELEGIYFSCSFMNGFDPDQSYKCSIELALDEE